MKCPDMVRLLMLRTMSGFIVDITCNHVLSIFQSDIIVKSHSSWFFLYAVCLNIPLGIFIFSDFHKFLKSLVLHRGMFLTRSQRRTYILCDCGNGENIVKKFVAFYPSKLYI